TDCREAAKAEGEALCACRLLVARFGKPPPVQPRATQAWPRHVEERARRRRSGWVPATGSRKPVATPADGGSPVRKGLRRCAQPSAAAAEPLDDPLEDSPEDSLVFLSLRTEL